MHNVGIAIPYFQHKAGLLKAALTSIFTQSLLAFGQCIIHIVIVDDSSPLPAAEELADFRYPERVNIVVKRQPNGGAGAARNAALAMLDDDIDVVAFLDSDDTWTPDHLSRAVAALENGADFYFSDAQRSTVELTENAALPAWFTNCLRPIPGIEALFCYEGPVDLAIVKGMVPMPSIVHRRRKAGSARFPSRYFRFGEDQFYCLQYLAEGGVVAYSSAVEVICGQGVNIFAGNSPGSEGQRLCFLDEIAFRKDALATLQLSPEARSHVKNKLDEAIINLLKQGLWQIHGDIGRWLMRSIMAQPFLLSQLPKALVAWFQERRQIRAISD